MAEVVHYLVGSASCCGKGWVACSDRAQVTCKRCISRMEAGAERPLNPYSPPSVKRRGPKRKIEEPKETMDAAGLRIVLDAPTFPLKRTTYP